MINNHLAVRPDLPRSLSETSETSPSEAAVSSLLSTQQYQQQFAGSTLRERNVECSEHSESVRRDASGNASDTGQIIWWYRYPEDPFEERDDIYRWIDNGSNDKIVELIGQGFNLDQIDSCDEPPLFYALNFGSLETVLLLLKLGADPNLFRVRPSFTSKSNGDYSLRETDKLSRLVLLLSYGAKLLEDNKAFGDVFEDNRVFRLAVYYFWEKYREGHEGPIPEPKSVEELNQLVFKLPVLQITAYISLFNEELGVLRRPSGILPANLQEFFDFVGA
ncbi:hypothetical protein [Endozoicomonas sp. GU-1]|uniref:hypothetical protein n=1 Tax=Endozoicomonas sp. GU-1 TaxID=3009078 RepID=UPI0022B4C566|nr:hypothetical protein [Endozoicomonas sp. GU-1]WBA83197.1 hypothetical protein O2T12_08805 [Endozoicomonas sp. GU-1]WBA86122.1 hypothetical protein O3276_23435 [Endozoicomonas sp. GU-1]